jgi:ATP-dependent HslUV protease ATP-binding subunit HslU
MSAARTPDKEGTLTPREIVAHLDRYIVGQAAAKKAVAIALRNRWRRKMVPPELADDISPKNIIMIGSTGVGKTEIARRLAKLAALPFLKIEASKFTEVGYVGRDVDSMVRDLMEAGVSMVRREFEERVRSQARAAAEERVLDLLLHRAPPSFEEAGGDAPDAESRRRQKLREQLRSGLLESREITISVQEKGFMPLLEVFGQQGMEEMGINLRNAMGNAFPQKRKEKRVRPSEAVALLEAEEAARLVDNDKVVEEARSRVEQTGIIFLDEIDKIAGRETGHGPDVSREGVQRDLLPIVEGTTVSTKYGPVRTDHILFIASGAFHVSKPSDLIPELQGRFPIRVELTNLGAEEFRRILVEPENSLIRQYSALLATEAVHVEFAPEAVDALANLAVRANEQTENIGARRLYTLMEKLLEDLSFDAPALANARVRFTREEVERKLRPLVESEDMSRYVL